MGRLFSAQTYIVPASYLPKKYVCVEVWKTPHKFFNNPHQQPARSHPARDQTAHPCGRRISGRVESALNLAVARLRYIASTAWSTRRYLNIELMRDQQMRGAISALPGVAQPKTNVRKTLDTSRVFSMAPERPASQDTFGGIASGPPTPRSADLISSRSRRPGRARPDSCSAANSRQTERPCRLPNILMPYQPFDNHCDVQLPQYRAELQAGV